jgi:hypothetical protein
MFTRFRDQVDEFLQVWDGNVGNVRQLLRLVNFRGLGRIFEEISANLNRSRRRLVQPTLREQLGDVDLFSTSIPRWI